MPISFSVKGDYSKTRYFLERAKSAFSRSNFDKYGQMGVEALSKATPVDTGKTAASWGYDIVRKNGRVSIEWYNTNVVKHVNIAIILQYGHATRNGYYVQGIDYINPALRPVFDQIANDAWGEVTRH